MLDPEVDSLIPHVPFNRRTFIKATFGTGFAAAVLPVSAQTIHTDSDGLEAGAIGIRGADGTLVPAYRAQPKGKTHLPVIIVIHEIFGVRSRVISPSRRISTRVRAMHRRTSRCSS
jgi:carboxymethylenebutenolidase